MECRFDGYVSLQNFEQKIIQIHFRYIRQFLKTYLVYTTEEQKHSNNNR